MEDMRRNDYIYYDYYDNYYTSYLKCKVCKRLGLGLEKAIRCKCSTYFHCKNNHYWYICGITLSRIECKAGQTREIVICICDGNK